MADSAEIVEPTSPMSGAAGPGGSARSAGPDRPAAAGASIRLDNLTKRYPDIQAPAVEDVTRDEATGESVTLVGPSGCGKSTTLKMINRLIEPTSGQITIAGEDVTGINLVAPRRTIGYAIQSTGLFPHMTVTENIGLVPKMAGRPRAKVRDRVEEMSNTVAGPRVTDPALVETARGIGMSPLMLFRVELPLAVRLILAGVGTALVLHVGTATPAAFGVGGGLGDLVPSGITNQRMPVLVLGSVLTVAMALITDWLGTLVDLLLRPRGLEVD
ncbi:ATP-binding cassette domain-containing protein [Streptomyces sp. NPDC017993]|uniref:ATP-binding cassette domain-containing protein n=1 Tax=Streptomyces sp. NPDC017993 TaxID=3365027 RepID=UPI00379B9503